MKFFRGGKIKSISSIHLSRKSTFALSKAVWSIFFSWPSSDFLGVAMWDPRSISRAWISSSYSRYCLSSIPSSLRQCSLAFKNETLSLPARWLRLLRQWYQDIQIRGRLCRVFPQWRASSIPCRRS
jgi:hypothetical protein